LGLEPRTFSRKIRRHELVLTHRQSGTHKYTITNVYGWKQLSQLKMTFAGKENVFHNKSDSHLRNYSPLKMTFAAKENDFHSKK
jgi:hypothetical protein